MGIAAPSALVYVHVTEIHAMKNRYPAALFLTILSLFASCALTQKPVLLEPIGPGPATPAASAPAGFLKVDTTVKCYPYDRQFYYAHTAYGVYDADGHRVRSVQNEASFHSSEAALVTLPAGSYNIMGWADGYELVKVPVVIKSGLLTEVNLEAHNKLTLLGAKQGDIVRMADGRVVGWSANVTTSP